MILIFLCCLFHPTKLIMEKPCNLNRYITRVWPWLAPEQHLVATLGPVLVTSIILVEARSCLAGGHQRGAAV